MKKKKAKPKKVKPVKPNLTFDQIMKAIIKVRPPPKKK